MAVSLLANLCNSGLEQLCQTPEPLKFYYHTNGHYNNHHYHQQQHQHQQGGRDLCGKEEQMEYQNSFYQQQQQHQQQQQQHQQQQHHQNRLHQLATNTLLAEKLLQNQTTLTALDGAGIPTSIAVTAAVVQGNGRAGKPPDIVIKGRWAWVGGLSFEDCHSYSFTRTSVNNRRLVAVKTSLYFIEKMA